MTKLSNGANRRPIKSGQTVPLTFQKHHVPKGTQLRYRMQVYFMVRISEYQKIIKKFRRCWGFGSGE